ncbi:MAG: serine/threonine-protein kinase [Planctomycetota bacterium]
MSVDPFPAPPPESEQPLDPAERHRQVNRAVETLLDTPDDDREDRIQELASGDTGLEKAIRKRLRYLDDDEDRKTESSDAPDLAPGDQLGDFHLIVELGGGGMGKVWKARQDKPSRLVALKVMRPGLRAEDLRELFGFEGFVHGSLRHQGVVHVYDVKELVPPGVGKKVPVIVMELVEGAEPITEWAQRSTADVRTICEVFAKVCDAVQHLHTKTLVHQDIKPSNVLIDHDGEPKLVDLGVCKPANSALEKSPRLRELWRRAGTPEYMSPEKRDARLPEADTQSDVYSLGVVLWEVLAGRHYIEREPGSTVAERMQRAIERAPEPPSTHRSGIPADVDAITLRALEASPRDRYRTAGQMAVELRRFLNHEPVLARGGGALYHLGKFTRRNRSGTIVALVITISAVLLAGVSAGFVLRARTLDDRTRTAEEARLSQERAASQALANSEAFESLINALLEAWADPRSLTLAPEQRGLLLTYIDDALVRLSQTTPESASPEDIRQRRLVEADVRWRLGNFYDEQTLYNDAARQFSLALGIYEQMNTSAERIEDARTRLAQAYLSLDEPRYEDAARLLAQAVGQEIERSGGGTLLAQMQIDWARALDGLGRHAESLERAREAIATIDALPATAARAATALREQAQEITDEATAQLELMRQRQE